MGKNYLIPKASHHSENHTIKFSGTLGKNKFFHGKNTKWATSVTGLHLVNKQISRECLGYLYNRIILFSDTSRRLINWMETVRPHRLALLTQLYLDHVTYGDPKFSEDDIWKIKSDRKWSEVCKLAVKSFPHLTKLVINVDVHDTPFRFTLTEPWIQPLLYFKQLQELKEVEVHVHSPCRRSTLFDNKWYEHLPPLYIRQLTLNDKGNNELHELFGLAVSMKILGFCDDCCLEELREAIFGRWKRITVQPPWSDIVQSQ